MKSERDLLRKVLKNGLKPIEKLSVSDWASRYRIISSGNAEPGRWKNSRTPYLKEVMDAFTDPEVHRIVLKSSAQIGKSECINNIIGRFSHLDPCPMMIVQPTIEMAQDYSKRRLAPMIRDCNVLSRLFYDDKSVSKSRDANQTILSKYFPGGSLVLAGANSPAGLASRPIRIVLFDEVDRFPASAASEGDPVDIASKRTATFWNAKIGLFSTPTLEDESRIDIEYLNGTQEVWSHICPRCGAIHCLQIESIFEINGGICWECPDCKNYFPEIVMKNAQAMYVSKNSECKSKTRSFFVNGFSSPWVEWREILREYEESQGNPVREQVVVNTRLGNTYKPHTNNRGIEKLLARREWYIAELPDEIVLLTAAVDVQDARLEYEICGWGIDEECWGIKKGIIVGKPSVPKVWELLDEILDRAWYYSTKKGGYLKIKRTFIDSGGHFTSNVYEYCKKNQNKGRFAIKGIGRAGIPFIDKTTFHEGLYLTSLGVNEGKEQVYSRLEIDEVGAMYFHFPVKDPYQRGYDERYFRGLYSEERVIHVKNGIKYAVYEPISSHIANEPLDLRVYNLAAMKSLRITHEKWLELAGMSGSRQLVPISTKNRVKMAMINSD